MEKQPKKSGKKWTPDERARADLLTGSLPTKEIAKKLKRSVKAIQHHYDTEGISPLNGDGRITLAELSRKTGTPLQTLVEWANMGKLSGVEKVGAYWRVDTTKIGEVKPLWDGKKYLPTRLAELGLSENSKLNSCLNCGLELVKGSNYYCSRKCRSEDMVNFKERQLTGEDKPEHHFPPQLRLPFQDFLANVGILKRDNNPRTLVSDPTSSALLRDRMQPLKVELDRLNGYVLPFNYIFNLVNNEQYDGEHPPHRFFRQMFDFRRTLANPEGVALSKRIGYGLDASIDMARIDIALLRILWQKEEVPIGMDYLMRNVTNMSHNISNAVMWHSISKLRTILAETSYQIVTIPQSKNGGGKYQFKIRTI